MSGGESGDIFGASGDVVEGVEVSGFGEPAAGSRLDATSPRAGSTRRGASASLRTSSPGPTGLRRTRGRRGRGLRGRRVGFVGFLDVQDHGDGGRRWMPVG